MQNEVKEKTPLPESRGGVDEGFLIIIGVGQLVTIAIDTFTVLFTNFAIAITDEEVFRLAKTLFTLIYNASFANEHWIPFCWISIYLKNTILI